VYVNKAGVPEIVVGEVFLAVYAEGQVAACYGGEGVRWCGVWACGEMGLVGETGRRGVGRWRMGLGWGRCCKVVESKNSQDMSLQSLSQKNL
jgi:hypothetical protein